MAVQILLATSAVRIIAVDLRQEVLDFAKASGAHAVVPAAGLTPGALRQEIGVTGASLILDCVGTDDTLELAVGACGENGTIVMVGRGGGTLGVKPFYVPLDASVTVSTWGTIPELHEVVALARSGALYTETQSYALAGALTAYRDLEAGRVLGRAVVLPGC